MGMSVSEADAQDEALPAASASAPATTAEIASLSNVRSAESSPRGIQSSILEPKIETASAHDPLLDIPDGPSMPGDESELSEINASSQAHPDEQTLKLCAALRLLETGHVVRLPGWRISVTATVPWFQIVAVVAQSMPQSLAWSSMNATSVNEALILDPNQVCFTERTQDLLQPELRGSQVEQDM